MKGTRAVTLEDVIAVLMDILPNAEVGEDNDGQVVIYTGLKMPTDGRVSEVKKPYLQRCICLADFCTERGLDEGEVLEALRNSDISFGTNDDTLVSVGRLCGLLEIPSPTADAQTMVSLGC